MILAYMSVCTNTICLLFFFFGWVLCFQARKDSVAGSTGVVLFNL